MMDHILDEAAAIVQCKECPWYKSCVLPIRVTPEDVRRQWQAMPGMSVPGNDYALGQMMASMTNAAQNTVLEGCPVFIQRLRSDQKLAERIKRMMLDWGKEESESRET